MFSLILLDLTLQEILNDIPHDAGAVTVYLLIALLIGFIIQGSRGEQNPPNAPQGNTEAKEPGENAEPKERLGV